MPRDRELVRDAAGSRDHEHDPAALRRRQHLLLRRFTPARDDHHDASRPGERLAQLDEQVRLAAPLIGVGQCEVRVVRLERDAVSLGGKWRAGKAHPPRRCHAEEEAVGVIPLLQRLAHDRHDPAVRAAVDDSCSGHGCCTRKSRTDDAFRERVSLVGKRVRAAHDDDDGAARVQPEFVEQVVRAVAGTGLDQHRTVAVLERNHHCWTTASVPPCSRRHQRRVRRCRVMGIRAATRRKSEPAEPEGTSNGPAPGRRSGSARRVPLVRARGLGLRRAPAGPQALADARQGRLDRRRGHPAWSVGLARQAYGPGSNPPTSWCSCSRRTRWPRPSAARSCERADELNKRIIPVSAAVGGRTAPCRPHSSGRTAISRVLRTTSRRASRRSSQHSSSTRRGSTSHARLHASARANGCVRTATAATCCAAATCERQSDGSTTPALTARRQRQSRWPYITAGRRASARRQRRLLAASRPRSSPPPRWPSWRASRSARPSDGQRRRTRRRARRRRSRRFRATRRRAFGAHSGRSTIRADEPEARVRAAARRLHRRLGARFFVSRE